MIYSRWRPDTGGYDYFETDERYGLADDLPVPSLLSTSPIGISSLKCGRDIPSGARAAGSGPFARGVIAPVSRAGLSGVGPLSNLPTWLWALGGAAAGAVGAFFWKRR